MFPLKTSSRQARDYFLHQPWLISFSFIILLALWLGLGDSNAEEPQTAMEIQVPLAKVGYQTFSATQTDKVIELYGRTAPDRQAKIGAEIAGRIAEVKIAKGQMVTKNQIIALIDKGDLDAQLERAKAQLKVRQQEFNAASALKIKAYKAKLLLPMLLLLSQMHNPRSVLCNVYWIIPKFAPPLMVSWRLYLSKKAILLGLAIRLPPLSICTNW